MAAQLTSTKGLSLRFDRLWMARATSSLPVPFSPVMSTHPEVGAAMAICSLRWRIRAVADHLAVLGDGRLQGTIFLHQAADLMALSMDSSTFSRDRGFSMKS
jgi:hypothetical protein